MTKIVATIVLALAVLGLAPTAQATTAPCSLRTYAWVPQGSGGMSHEYETVEFVNVGAGCLVHGFPALSGRVGTSAVRLAVSHQGSPVSLWLRHGQHAYITLDTLTAYASPVARVGFRAGVAGHTYAAGSLLATRPGSSYPVYETSFHR